MAHRTEVLVVGESPCTAAGSVLDRPGFTGRVRSPSSALEAFEASPPDCLIVCGESLPAALGAAASQAGCPIVDCTDDSLPMRNLSGNDESDEMDVDVGGAGDETDAADETDTDEGVATDETGADDETDADRAADDGAGDTAGLNDRIRAAVGGTPNRDRIARLHEGSAELVGLDDRGQLHKRVVDIAAEVLGFDAAVLFRREEDGFYPSAATDDERPDRLAPDHGMVAHVFDTGESALVDDIESHPIAEQRVGSHRSGLVVPFGEDGVFGGLSSEHSTFDEVDLELAELLVNHGSQVDARIGAEESLRERQARITRLHRAAPSIIDAKSESALYERVVDIAEDVLELDQSVLLMDQDGELTPVGGRTHKLSSVSTEAGILGRTYNEGRSFLVDDADEHPDAEPANETIQSAISVPVGETGVFQVFSDDIGAFDEADLELAELLIGYVEATLDRMRSEAALRESRRVIERLHETAMDLATAETEAELLERAVAAAEDVLDLDMCKIDLRRGDMLVPVAESGGVPTDAGREMHVSEGLAGKTARTGDSFLIDDLESDPDSEPTSPDFRSAISVPVGDLGVFQAVATEEGAFEQEDLDLAELLMAHVAVALRRARAEAELRHERDSLAALFENIPGAAVSYEMIDGEPIVRRVNGAFERTFGYDADEIVGESLDEYIVSPADEASAARYNDKLAEGERVQTEVERQTADGSKHFLLQVTPLEVGEENAPGYAIYSDVTEQREREAELRRQNERLDQFASVVSHDLRNPLNVAAGYLDLVRETGDLDKLDNVEDALGRMDALVSDLLRLAREGQDVGETRSIDLDAVARTAWNHVATEDASLDVETDREVDADPDRLIELFENLYRNSVEHAGAAPTVTVGALSDREGFFVADDGSGVDPDIDPFDTGVTTSDEGTGFGLPIIKSIAEAHGWSVEAAASEDGGARFEFETA